MRYEDAAPFRSAPMEKEPVHISIEAGLDPETHEWARGAPPADLVLALNLGARCLKTVGAVRPPNLALLIDLGARCLKAVGLSPDESTASAEKGIRGEDEVFDLLARSRRVRDVSRRAHSGDLICDSNAGPVYVEVKHYASTVPAAETTKFLRDLREQDAAAGVLLSLTSPIAGHRDRGAITIVLEPRVSTGTLVPIVYAAPPRGEGNRLHHDVVLAAVDMAVCLAEAYPRGVRGLHGRDSILTYAIAADQLADGAASIRTDLSRLATGLSGDLANLDDQLVSLRREARSLAKSQRSESEEVREETPTTAAAFAIDLAKTFSVCASTENLTRVVHAIEETSLLAGAIGEGNRWRLLKARAVHVHSGCAFAFLKGVTEVRVPATNISAEIITATLKAHPKRMRLADGEIALELIDATVADILILVDSA